MSGGDEDPLFAAIAALIDQVNALGEEGGEEEEKQALARMQSALEAARREREGVTRGGPREEEDAETEGEAGLGEALERVERSLAKAERVLEGASEEARALAAAAAASVLDEEAEEEREESGGEEA